MYTFVSILMLLWGSFACLAAKVDKKQAEGKGVMDAECSRNDPQYKESEIINKVYFLRQSIEKCDYQCELTLVESNNNGFLYRYFITSNGTFVIELPKLGKSSNYTYKSQIGGPNPAIGYVPKVTPEYMVTYEMDNNKEFLEVWTPSLSSPVPKITSSCVRNRTLNDCKTEKNCKNLPGTVHSKNCFAEIPGFKEEMYTDYTWFLKYSSEKCDTTCGVMMGQSTGKKLKEFFFEGNKPPTGVEWTRIGSTSTYFYTSQRGTQRAICSIAAIDKNSFVEYLLDNGQETINVFVTSPFVTIPKKFTGCGAGVKFYDCKPEISCIKV